MQIDKYPFLQHSNISKYKGRSNVKKNNTYLDSTIDQKLIHINNNRHTIASYNPHNVNQENKSTIPDNFGTSYDRQNEDRYSFTSQPFSPDNMNININEAPIILTPPNLSPSSILQNRNTNYGIFEDSSSEHTNTHPFDDDEFGNLPIISMLDNATQFVVDGEVLYNRSSLKTFYILELIGSLIYSFFYSNNILLILSMRISNNYLAYQLKIIFDSIALLLIIYSFTNVATYKSLNITLEYTLINSIIFNYDLLIVFKYILLEFISAIVGSLLLLGICYTYFLDIPSSAISFLIPPVYTNVYIYLVVNTITYIIFLISSTLVIMYGTSLSCKKTVINKIIISLFLNSLFIYNAFSINNIIVSYAFRISYSIIHQNLSLLSTIDLYIYLAYLVLIMMLTPLLIKYFNTKFKTWYARYIES
jgi:hypothetical protein